jgi:hypothetical protein
MIFAPKIDMGKEVVISNSKLNDRGTRVLTSGIDIKQYQRNPVLLWQHSRPYRGTKDEVLPIGKIDNLRIDGDSLIGTPVFDEGDEFAKQIKAKWDAGFLKMVSAGIDIIETSEDITLMVPGQRRATITKSKLYEVSIVDIGSNDDAIVFYKEGKRLNMSSCEDSLIIPEITFNNNLNKNEMKSIALKLGLSEGATEAEILIKIGRLQMAAATAESLQKQIDEQLTEAIECAVETAIKAKKITADKKEHFVKLGKTSGMEVLNSTLDMLTPAVKPTDVVHQTIGTGRETKKFSELSAKERIDLRASDKEKYASLFAAEYGFEPKLH